jgi:hypothetical protein
MGGFVLNYAGLREDPGLQCRHLMRAKVFVACTKTSYEYYNKWRQYQRQFQDLGWSAPDDSVLRAMEYGPLFRREVEEVRGRLQRESAKCTRCNRRVRPSHNRPVPYARNAVIPDARNEVLNAPNAVRDMSNEGPGLPAVPEPVANDSSNSDDDDVCGHCNVICNTCFSSHTLIHYLISPHLHAVYPHEIFSSTVHSKIRPYSSFNIDISYCKILHTPYLS